MSGEAWLFLFAVLINAVNLFLQVFFTIMYSDLEWYATPDPSAYERLLHCSLFGCIASFLLWLTRYLLTVTTSTLSTFATA